MPEEPNVEILKNGTMRVSCDSGRFASIRRAICDEIGQSESVDEVTEICVTDTSRWKRSEVHGRYERVALVGCAVASFLLIFVFIAGITKVIEMFR
ncbi:MAG TPA: hypothetical protein VGY55_07715 [Pirellulales bacterium]|jgi:hypothetical protein|nr:hypothetical protein [Pirellulales bacterium]